MVLDKRENKSADTGRFELAYRDSIHPGFKCVDTRFYIEGARIRKYELQRYSELDKKMRQKEKRKNKTRHDDNAKTLEDGEKESLVTEESDNNKYA